MLVGADKCLKTPATCDLSKSVVVNTKKNTVTFHLIAAGRRVAGQARRPARRLLPVGHAEQGLRARSCRRHGRVHVHEVRPEPRARDGAQPVLQAVVGRCAARRLRRQHHLHFGQTVEAQITQIENGTADWTLESPPADRLNEIGTKYASQVHINTQLANWYLPMNTNLKPFNKQAGPPGCQLRDRPQPGRAHPRRPEAGDPELPDPPCRLPGARRLLPVHEEPGREVVGPRPRQGQGARQAVGHGGRRRSPSPSRTTRSTRRWPFTSRACSTRSASRRRSRPISGNIHFTYTQNTKNKVQISVTQWYQDYPAPSDFLYVLLGCASFHPGSDTSVNIAGYCNKKIDAEMKQALKLGIPNPAGRAQAVDEDRPRDHRRVADRHDAQPAADQLPLQEGRQLRLERAVLHDVLEGLGPVVRRAPATRRG